MDGYSHELVALVALASLDSDERGVLGARWAGIEAGATLSDHFRVMWEFAEIGDAKRQLVHRCFIDSDDPKDHGCVTKAHDYAIGSVGFFEEYMAGRLSDGYASEESFLENLGMYLGIVSHHVADLCTPVHVGHKMNYRLVREYFWEIARATYDDLILCLEDLYARKDEEAAQHDWRTDSAQPGHSVAVTMSSVRPPLLGWAKRLTWPRMRRWWWTPSEPVVAVWGEPTEKAQWAGPAETRRRLQRSARWSSRRWQREATTTGAESPSSRVVWY